MSDEEDDYMADSFLVAAKSYVIYVLSFSNTNTNIINYRDSSNVVKKIPSRPGPTRPNNEPIKKRRIHDVEKEMREQGLGTAISGDNKGFAMMAKMGYKAGQSIGKASTKGIVEPIGIQVKSDRGGLGREEALRQLQERRLELVRKRKMGADAQKVEVSVEDFRRRLTQQANERQIAADLGLVECLKFRFQ